MTKYLTNQTDGKDVADAVQIALEDIGADVDEVLAGLIRVIIDVSASVQNPQALLDEVVDQLMEAALDA